MERDWRISDVKEIHPKVEKDVKTFNKLTDLLSFC
jgi:hypothetical protein